MRKPRKALKKRIKITGTKKVMCRHLGLGHFNAKASGNQTRRKRKKIEIKISKKILANI